MQPTDNQNQPRFRRKHFYAIGGIIVFIVLAIIFRFIIFPSTLNDTISMQSLFGDLGSVQQKSTEKKTFDASLVQSEKFRALQEFKVSPKTINEIEFGQKNIFPEGKIR